MATLTKYDLLLDIFKRADKNDNGELSKEEFVEFFADDVASNEELLQLFKEIDSNKNDSISPEELAAHFDGKMSVFEPAFETLGGLGSSVQAILTKTYETDVKSPQHFTERFLLKEVIEHLSVVVDTLSDAHTKMTSAAQNETESEPFNMHEEHNTALTAATPSQQDMNSQMDRLQAQVDRLETMLNRTKESRVFGLTAL
eukprot:m.46724 g.46724  ORF g.46724 m.46724 type:complete len:200 (-) comp10399_c0_seq1:2628-3227(-)